MKKLEGKVAIVTGASSGMGRAIAITCAEEGAKVICSDLRKSASPDGFESNIAVDTDQFIRDTGGETIFVACDVSKLDQVEALVNTAVKEFGQLDIMFNNAGVFTGIGGIVEKPEKDFDFSMNVNVKGTWNGCQQAIKQFLKQGNGGKIINTSSIAGVVGLPGEPDYCTSKGAIVALTKQLAVDFGPNGIYVNAICPGSVRTAMTRSCPNEALDYLHSVTPLRRSATPEEIAKPAVFLATSDADFITGNIMLIDGGITARC